MIFEYKEDDMVRCKKFRKGDFEHQNIYTGTEYRISNIWIIAGSGEPTFKPSRGVIRVNGVDFGIDEFYDYFYSKKEIRQLKLNKINKNV